jgi:hypothetical protein
VAFGGACLRSHCLTGNVSAHGHVYIERAPIAWYPSRLLVACHGERVEIGRFLNEKERQSLAKEMQGMVSGDGWSHAAQ